MTRCCSEFTIICCLLVNKLEMERRARVSLGPPMRAETDTGPVRLRKRAVSISGSRAVR